MLCLFARTWQCSAYEHKLHVERSEVGRQRCHMASTFAVFVDSTRGKLPTLNWLLNFIKDHINHIIVTNSSLCSTIELSILLTTCLKTLVLKYFETDYERNDRKSIWSIENFR